MTFTANNTAHAASFVAQVESDIALVATGLDADAKHFYNTNGKYIGTRFTDGSAISPLACGGCVEYLGTFEQEG